MNSGNCKKSYILILDYQIKEGNFFKHPNSTWDQLPALLFHNRHLCKHTSEIQNPRNVLQCHQKQLSFDISGAWVAMFEGTIKTASEQTRKCESAPYHVKLI